MQLVHGLFPPIWYVAAAAADIQQQPIGRRICDKPVVLCRTASGQAFALEDRCSHRAMPLSHGQCVGEALRCPYHGLEFDARGACVRIPGQSQIPPAAAVRAYPLVEKDRILWIWMGDPALADPSRIPDNPVMNDPAWELQTFYAEIGADWQLLADNLLDLSHVAHVHRNTIGAAEEEGSVQLQVKASDNSVLMERHLANFDPPPSLKAYESAGIRFAGKVDRWWDVEFVPGMLRYWSGTVDAGTGAFEGRRVGGFQVRHLDALTPATATSCYYNVFLLRSYMLGDADMTRRLHEMTAAVLAEDRAVVEAQQQRLLEEPHRPLFDIRSDAAQVQGRRLIQRWMSAAHQ